MAKLTKPQLDALTLLSLAGKRGATPYGMGQGNNTLQALVRRGLAQLKPALGDDFFPRLRKFAITDDGHAALRSVIERRDR